MKLRKLFAWLMTLVMLLGMVPAAHAELAGCNHDWDSGKWLRGEPQNCLDWKPKTYTCTICGATATNEECGPCVPGAKTWVRPQGSTCQEYGVWEITCKYCGEWLEGGEEAGPHKWRETIVEEPWCDVGGMKAMICSVCGEWQGNGTPLAPLGHDWGSWRWAHGSAPSCTEGAWQVRECKRCGRMEDRYVQGSDHKFGEWITTVEPTCTERGRHHHICSVCGYSAWEPIPTVDHIWGEWHVIEEPQVGIPGTERRSCTFGCGLHEDREIPPLEEALELPGLELTLTLDSTPANGEYFVVGEQVVFTASWSNLSPFELFPFYVSIWPYEQPSRDSQDLPYSCSFDAEEPITPGMTGSHSMVITVTEEDVARGGIYAMAYIWSSVHNGPEVEEVTTPFVTAPCGEGVPGNSTGVRLEKELRNAPANGEYYVPGEVLNYALTLRIDDGLLLDDAAIYDPINGGDGLVISYGKGLYGSMGMDVFYTVTEEDAQRGYVENTAYATWVYQDSGEAGRCESETVIALCGMGELPEDYEPLSILEVETVATTTPANGSYYVEGETVILVDRFTNRSANLTLTGSDWVNVEILGLGIFNRNDDFGADAVLAPGETRALLTSTYVITAEDAAQGYIQKTVHAGFTDENDLFYTGSFEIRIPCAPEAEGLTVTKTASAGDYSDPCKPGDEVTFTITVTNNTGVELLDVEITDPVKGSNEDSIVDIIPSMQPGESVTASFSYTVTEEDATVGVEGFENTAYATGYTADGTQVSGTSETIFVWCVIEHGLTFFKSIANVPANGVFFVPGETIVFKISMFNHTPYPLYNIILTDPLCQDQYIYDEINDMSYLYFGELYNEGNAMGESTSATVTVSYVVTEADAEAGSVTNTAEVTYQTWYGKDLSDSDGATAPCGPGSNDAIAPVVVTKAVANTPANGEYFVVGETIEFSITVTNNSGYELAGMIITDALDVDWICEPNELLLPGESRTETFSYVVTELDAAAGCVENYATVRIIEADGYHFFTSNVATAPCSPSGADGDMEYPVYNGYVTEKPFGVITGLEVTKVVESLPLNGLYYTEGETVAYRITYVNIGETPLTDVMIYDSLASMTEIASAENLAVSENRWCTFNYTVTAEDVARGYVSNTAIGQFEIDGYLHVVASETVIVDTDGQPDPEIPEGILPPGGVIDVSKLNSDQYCRRVTSSRTNVSYSWGTSFCSDHANIQGSILMMEQAATTPEMQLQTANYAVALWHAEVDKLYEELLGAADPQARAVIMAEYVSFLTHASNYETLLNVIYPDQPLVVAQKMANLWEEKCITLCQEMHMPVAARQDSFLAVEIATMEGISDACTCVTYDEGKGWNNFEQNYCPAHSFPFVMIDMLLAGQDTAEAWTTVRQIWNVELRSGYNKLIALLGENSDVALAEYATLENWMIAREAELTVLYPDNPELVAQTMVRIVIDQVNALCQLAQ